MIAVKTLTLNILILSSLAESECAIGMQLLAFHTWRNIHFVANFSRVMILIIKIRAIENRFRNVNKTSNQKARLREICKTCFTSSNSFKTFFLFRGQSVPISVFVTLTHRNRQIVWAKRTEYMKTSRGAKARECSCTCFIYFVSRQLFFYSFSRATSLFGSVGARNRPCPVSWIISLSYSAHPTIFWGHIIMRLICLIILLLGAMRMRASYCVLIFV